MFKSKINDEHIRPEKKLAQTIQKYKTNWNIIYPLSLIHFNVNELFF